MAVRAMNRLSLSPRSWLPAGAAALGVCALALSPAALAAGTVSPASANGPAHAGASSNAASTSAAALTLTGGPLTASQSTSRAAFLPTALPSTSLSSHVTDDAGLFTASTAEQTVSTLRDAGANLWIVTYSDESTSATAFAEQAWRATGLGSNDLLFVVNINDANRSYAFDGASNGGVWSSSQLSSAREDIRSALSAGNWDAALEAISAQASGSGSGSSSSDVEQSSSSSGGRSVALPVVLGAGTAILGGVVAVAASRNSRRRHNGSAATGQGSAQGPAGWAALPLPELKDRATQALMTADAAVDAAEEEVFFAQAQFGLGSTDALKDALTQAGEALSQAYAVRDQIEREAAAQPLPEARERELYVQMAGQAQRAVDALAEQTERLKQRRDIEASVPQTMAETRQRLVETEQSLRASQTLLTTLQATYPASALASVAGAPERGLSLIDAARTALDQAQASVSAGQNGTAVEQVKIARSVIMDADALASQVRSAHERLRTAASDLDAAIASISSDLVDAERLRSQVPLALLQPAEAEAHAAVTQGRQALAIARGGATGGSASAAGIGAGANAGSSGLAGSAAGAAASAAAGNAASATGSAGATTAGVGHLADPLAALDRLHRAEAVLDGVLAAARSQEEQDERARGVVGSRFARLESQYREVTTYQARHRDVVSASARNMLAEAGRHYEAAHAQLQASPAAALAEVEQAEPLLAQAQAIAEADVRRGGWDSEDDDWGSGYSGRRRQRGSDYDLSNAALSAILLGSLFGGSHGNHSGHSRSDDWGGFGGGGSFGGGGFGGGGGSFGGGGGGFGGGGGSF